MNRNEVNRVVYARARPLTVLVDASLLLIAAALLFAAGAMLISRDVDLALLGFGVVFGFGIARVALSGLTARHWVDLAGIEKRNLFGRRYVTWDNVREVWVQTNYFGGFNVDLTIDGSRHMPLVTSLIGNGAELIKAILEAATTSNPDVVLRGWSLRAYGAPPFGIFAQLDREA